MKVRTTLALVAALALTVQTVLALNPDDELWIPAAARGEGSAGSFWMTDLYLLNLGEVPVTVELSWLERFADNSDADGLSLNIGAGETLVLDDVVQGVFGQAAGTGAIRVEAAADKGGKAADVDPGTLVANARIYTVDQGATYGQGFEGIPSLAAISATGQTTTHVVGISDNSAFRTNWYGLNITEDAGEPGAAEVMVEVLDLAGNVLASRTVTMAPLEPVLYPVSGLGAGSLDNGTLRFTMVQGEGLFGASKVDELSNDPTTLEAHWECGSSPGSEEEFTDEFFIEDCTFTATGRRPFWVLEPGFQLVLEGDDGGEEIVNTITVLDETQVVDAVQTRVVEERETVDGELEEVSRNYFAICTETGSVFYFGEDVDIYDNGQVVSHDGAWLAGENGAEPGIMMPGTTLIGSRYFQEIAPGVAMDRAEHLAMGLTVQTDAGTFTNCLQVRDTSPLDPGLQDIKVYCPGLGLVVDEVLKLVEYTDPSAP